ncbi:hypothetical protein KUV59_05050 [Marinobacter daepoensis]|uniref:glycosyltransferase n=1 Tax=Marinobacter daepoensis TaxID=262077 RepID=UPI001C98778C|nr:glycosyltransferase [Marinobacter daepoensis]MBY6032523.1 hypothetical protein [Marinobacter daepoensis]
MKKKQNRMWITWENQRRNRSLSEKTGFILNELISDRGRILRYFLLSFRTYSLIRSNNPSVVVCQNPSVVLVIVCALLKSFFGYKFIVDCHNSGLYPKEGRYNILNRIAIFVNSHADAVIVSNEMLKEDFKHLFKSILVIPDPLPNREHFYDNELGSPIKERRWRSDPRVKFLYVCSWAEDEPYEEVLNAFIDISESKVSCYVTGDFHRKVAEIPENENIIFTGFLSDTDYHDLIISCDAMIVLTRRNDCLTCGAYEALAECKPSIFSDTAIMRNTFGTGFLYSEPFKEDILKNVLLLAEDVSVFYPRIVESRNEFQVNFQKNLVKFEDEVSR